MGEPSETAVQLEECRRALEASEARIRNLIVNHADGIVIVDAEGTVRFANPAAEALFNRPASDLVGAPFGFPAVAGETSEIDVLRAGGQLAVAEVRVVATEWEGGSANLASLRDITDRKRAEEERLQLAREQAARAEAEEASRLKDEFLARVSHELRTPLNVILGWARMLQEDTLDPSTQRRGVEMIVRHADLQCRIVDDLLDVSRIVTGQVLLDIHPVDLGGLARDCVDSMRLPARAKDIHVELHVDPGAGPVMGDPLRLRQVVCNVLSNAMKFTPPEGRVEFRLEPAGPNVMATVRDTGAGVAPEFLPHVFDRFRQADGSSTRKHGGLGLGLAIAKHLVEMHGGTIEVESPGTDRGTTVRIRLPHAVVREDDRLETTPGPETGRGAGAASRAGLTGVRVLLVEDQPDTRVLVETILAGRGAEVSAVGTAEEALQRLAAEAYDVLLADIGMSGTDGYALIRRIRSREAGERAAGLPAIALTAYARSEERSRALAAGYDLHVSKPVDQADLVAVVAALAARPRR